MRVLIALVLFCLAFSFGDDVAFTTHFTGGLPFCSQCGTPGQYACSPGVTSGTPLGQWNDGKVSFTDPIPAGNYATRLVVSVYGAYTCDGTKRAMFGLSLNGNVHGVRETVKGTTLCKCDACDGVETFTLTFRNGVPGYYYKTNNYLQLVMYRDSVCINRVEVTISYDPILTSPPTPLPEYYLPLPIPTGYDRAGCAVCNKDLGQWCSASNNNTLQLSFKDPLPSGVLLVAVDAYISLNMMERSTGYLTTLSTNLQGNTIQSSVSVADSSFREKCGCLGDYAFKSEMYQRGWPGYAVGDINRFQLTASKYSQSYGNVCVGRLALKLIYYRLTTGTIEELHIKDFE